MSRLLTFERLPELFPGLRGGFFRCVLGGHAAGRLRADLRVAFGEHAFEPGAFGDVLTRHDFQGLQGGADAIERLASLAVLGRQPLKLGCAGQLRALVALPLCVTRVAQPLQLVPVVPSDC